MKQTLIKRGDIFFVDFDPSKGTEIQKRRPSIILSHDLINEHSTRVIVAPITSNLKKVYSFEYAIIGKSFVSGKIMMDQMRSIDKSRLSERLGNLSVKEMQDIEHIIKFVLGL